MHYFDHTISYGELDRMSDAFAVALREMGVQKGDRVGVYLQNMPQYLIAEYGVWKAGAIVVPLNPMFKEHELTYHLSDSGAVALVCLESLYESAARNAVGQTPVKHVITTNELDYLGDQQTPAMFASARKQRFEGTHDLAALVHQYDGRKLEPPGLGLDDIALLSYTSGTTGRPKGAMNTHRNVVYNAEVYRTWMRLDERDVVVGVAPFFHITGAIAHVAVAALAGMPIIMCYRFDAGEVLRLIEKWRGTFTVASITVFLALMDHPDITRRDLSSMTKVYSGGAPVSEGTVRNFERLTGAYIHNVYGLTETTSPSHAVPFGARAPVDQATGALSVGVPVPGFIVRVVDPTTGEDVAPGELGEFYTKGPGVVPGYWERPDATHENFTDGYLHTGDVGTMDERGYFYIMDRSKDMINAAGFKVWPREVEDILYTHPAVREAAVIGVPDPYRGETVKAFVALKREYEGKVTGDEFVTYCRERIAAYKVPRMVEILPELPKTPTGKFLRRELRQREVEAMQAKGQQPAS